MVSRPVILVVDDELRSQETLRRVLDEEFDVVTASNALEAERLLEGEMVQVILCDQRMPGQTGVEFLSQVRERWPEPVRMIISGFTESEDIIAGVNEAGIYRYITKPWDPDELLEIVRGAVQLYNLQQENESASVEMKMTAGSLKQVVAKKQSELKRFFEFGKIIRSPESPLEDACELARRSAEFDISVLITGESGTGKELMARAIHYASGRADKPFVVENCGALPDELLESELFGCKKGAFTGAYQDRIGLFEKASGGTVFLDEIGETSPAFQVKLLRVLQEGEIRPLGAQRTRSVDVRVITATNRDLEQDVRSGRFRQDLFYRLAAFPVHLPPLRDRPMDIPLVAQKLLNEAAETFGKPVDGFSKDVEKLLLTYAWPGNVREMQNEIQRMVALADGDYIGLDVVSERLKHNGANGLPMPVDRRLGGSALPSEPGGGTLKDRVEELEAQVIETTLERYGWNISQTSSALGLSRVGLRSKLQRYGLARPDDHVMPS